MLVGLFIKGYLESLPHHVLEVVDVTERSGGDHGVIDMDPDEYLGSARGSLEE